MSKIEQTELMNLCMIYDNQGNVLVQNRAKASWPGIAFPGGHVEPGESFVQSAIREVKEETGLEIRNPRLCGVKQWQSNEIRKIVFFFKTNEFSGQLRSSEEGEVFWVPLEQISALPLAFGFLQNLQVFLEDDKTELIFDSRIPGEPLKIF